MFLDSPALPTRCARRYELLMPLGSGSQGVVVLARQIALDRLVAIKLLVAPDLELRGRFEIEARLAAQLAHPNVVRVLDHDLEDDQPWIAFEYVEGRSL